ncbi:MAG: ABC transporter substrate binding protein (PQQ-dependent alcohol dehydrogenase system) [Motiliproteus sp.]|jgi:ABC transporter substrate binding protein (PQQ-dependent alcohol dehydrogenase system)
MHLCCGNRPPLQTLPLLLTGVLAWVLSTLVSLPALAATAVPVNTASVKTESAALNVRIGYLELLQERPPLLSNVLPEPEDSGLQGARLGIEDNNAGGRFLGQHYQLLESRSTELAGLLEQARQWHDQGIGLLIVNLPAEPLRQLSTLFSADEILLFNIGAPDNALRTGPCLSNSLHSLPSRAMLTDALAQWMASKKLNDWLLIQGQRPADMAYAASLRRSARRFGSRILETKTWTFDTDLRRSAQTEVPLFTQGPDYDALVVADELGDFGEYLLYNSWLPRPVVGTQGLTAVGWHRVVEQWGAAQLQSRFQQSAGRWMNGSDYAGWIALRSIGEGIAALNDPDPLRLRQQLLSEPFQLAGYLGRKLSYRTWNGQLRRPIPLIHPRALVSQSPQPGFLHPHNDLDTLGFDQAESQCQDLISGAVR